MKTGREQSIDLLPKNVPIMETGLRLVRLCDEFKRHGLLRRLFEENSDFIEYFADIYTALRTYEDPIAHFGAENVYVILDHAMYIARGFQIVRLVEAAPSNGSGLGKPEFCAEFSHGIDNEFRGYGIAALARQYMDSFIFENIPEIAYTYNMVPPSNISSHRASFKLPRHYERQFEAGIDNGTSWRKCVLTREAYHSREGAR